MSGTDHSKAADWPPGGPVSILVEPQMGENIGAAARAMWNFGLRELRIVDPRDGWPNPAAVAMASGAGGLLDEADIPLFEALEPGDIAFFDSSHILWPGTDVDMMLNRILPVLATGVLVHIHDILLPDPYPPEWDWRGYTEQNGLAGWILGGAFETLFSSHYALTRMKAAARPAITALPLPESAFETSLWLRRV
jgi:hypothetical protein